MGNFELNRNFDKLKSENETLRMKVHELESKEYNNTIKFMYTHIFSF